MASMDGGQSSDEGDTLVISEQDDGEIIFKPQLRRQLQDKSLQDKMERRHATAAHASEESAAGFVRQEASHRVEQHRRLDKTETATTGAATRGSTALNCVESPSRNSEDSRTAFRHRWQFLGSGMSGTEENDDTASQDHWMTSHPRLLGFLLTHIGVWTRTRQSFKAHLGAAVLRT